MRVVMAHGCYDLLHPGHVAHLEEAKAMGDYLVVGITADDYVAKGPGRPSVTAMDRARAVRALRCVDHVVIDAHATPEDLIAYWKPAIFVKGADYQGQDLPEQAWVGAYGGEVRFTNGDVMYHSRQWVNGDARAAMTQQGVTPADLLGVLDVAATARIHVVGDVIVDEVADGEMIGPLTLRVDRRERWLGGAAAVALHAAAAGAQVTLTHSYPEGSVGEWAGRALAESTVRCYPILVRHESPHKTRHYGPDGLLCQIDDVDSRPIPRGEIALFADRLRAIPADAVICADYRHGVFHAESLPVLRAAIPEHALKVADSQVASRWGNITDFHCFDLVTPNEREARWATGDQDSSITVLAERLLREHRFQHVLVTRAELGLLGTAGYGTAFTVPALATQAVDPVGAGDALLAYATLGLLASGRLGVAAWLGSVAAAIACGRRGNSPVTAAEVRAWLGGL